MAVCDWVWGLGTGDDDVIMLTIYWPTRSSKQLLKLPVLFGEKAAVVKLVPA